MPYRFMTARGRWKWLFLLSGLIATGIAAFVGPTDARRGPPGAALPPSHVPVVAVSLRSAAALPVRETLGRARNDPFAARSWAPPPPPPPTVQASEAPAAPAVPPLPYRFAGTVQYGGRLSVVLAAGERIHLVRPGQVIDEVYYVRAMSREAVTLVYTPLGVDQQLAHAPQAN
jgi:hypothetical protein